MYNVFFIGVQASRAHILVLDPATIKILWTPGPQHKLASQPWNALDTVNMKLSVLLNPWTGKNPGPLDPPRKKPHAEWPFPPPPSSNSKRYVASLRGLGEGGAGSARHWCLGAGRGGGVWGVCVLMGVNYQIIKKIVFQLVLLLIMCHLNTHYHPNSIRL